MARYGLTWKVGLVGFTLVAAACAGSESGPAVEGDSPQASTTVTDNEPTQGVTTTTIGESPPTFSELEDLAFEGEVAAIDVALTGFSLIFGQDIDGALPVTVDDSIPDELTPVIDDLRALDDQLTDAQRAQIEAVLDEIEASARLMYDSETAGPDANSGSPGDALGAEVGISRSGLVNARLAGLSLTDERLNELRAAAERYVMSKLGGERPSYRMSTIEVADLVGEETRWNGWATTTVNDIGKRVCDVFIVNRPGRDETFFKAVIVHEFFHCWHGKQFPLPVTEYWDVPKWIKEGLAEWVESEYTLGGSNSDAFAHQFISNHIGKLYSSSYAAVAFWWQINDLDGGPAGLWSRIPDIANQSNSPEAFRAATSGLRADQVAQLASSSAQFDATWGPAWRFVGRDLRSGDFRPVQSQLVAAAAYRFVNPGQQQVVAYEFTLDESEPWIIEITQTGLTVGAWTESLDTGDIYSSDSVTTTWCLSPECECWDGRNLFPSAVPVPYNEPIFYAGLTGGATEQATISARAINVNEACDDLEPSSELAGVWVADPAAIVAAYAEAYAEIGVTVTGASGELSMTLWEDNTATVTYDKVRLGLDDPSGGEPVIIDEITINGGGILNWETSDGRLVFSGLSNFNLSILTPAISSEPLVISSEDIGSPEGTTTSDYVREGSLLTLSNTVGSLAGLADGSAGVLVLPKVWIRVGDTPAP
jgi:hypothetical protein